MSDLVLDEVKEALTDEDGNIRYRKLGLIVARGTLLVVISPVDGSEEIPKPVHTGGGMSDLVLDEVKEALTDEDGNIRYRKLGLIVARGTLLVVISPVDGSEEIPNPFIQEEE